MFLIAIQTKVRINHNHYIHGKRTNQALFQITTFNPEAINPCLVQQTPTKLRFQSNKDNCWINIHRKPSKEHPINTSNSLRNCIIQEIVVDLIITLPLNKCQWLDLLNSLLLVSLVVHKTNVRRKLQDKNRNKSMMAALVAFC